MMYLAATETEQSIENLMNDEQLVKEQMMILEKMAKEKAQEKSEESKEPSS